MLSVCISCGIKQEAWEVGWRMDHEDGEGKEERMERREKFLGTLTESTCALALFRGNSRIGYCREKMLLPIW